MGACIGQGLPVLISGWRGSSTTLPYRSRMSSIQERHFDATAACLPSIASFPNNTLRRSAAGVPNTSNAPSICADGRWPIVRPWTICCNPYCPSPLVSTASQHRARAAYRWAVDVTVYIRESERRTAVGHTLYKALLPILTPQGFRSAYAGISQPNAGSVALHERLGFRHIGTYQNVGYKLGRWHDVGYWHLQLITNPSPPIEICPYPDLSN